NIPVSGFGACRGEADRDEIADLGGSDGGADRVAERLLIGDVVVRREASHDRTTIAALDESRGQREGGAGPGGRGLDDDVAFGQVGELAGDGDRVGRAADYHNAFRRRQLADPIEGLLEQGFVTEQREQELGTGRPAEGPESGAGASCRDHAPEVVDMSLVPIDRKSTRLNSSHVKISYAVFC